MHSGQATRRRLGKGTAPPRPYNPRGFWNGAGEPQKPQSLNPLNPLNPQSSPAISPSAAFVL